MGPFVKGILNNCSKGAIPLNQTVVMPIYGKNKKNEINK